MRQLTRFSISVRETDFVLHLEDDSGEKMDFAASPEHALPGQAISSAQDFRYLASASGKAGGLGNRAIGRHLPARNLQNHRTNARLRRKLLTGRQA